MIKSKIMIKKSRHLAGFWGQKHEIRFGGILSCQGEGTASNGFRCLNDARGLTDVGSFAPNTWRPFGAAGLPKRLSRSQVRDPEV